MHDYQLNKCSKCEYSEIVYKEDEPIDCYHCGSSSQLINYDFITDAEVILDIIESELENANYHSLTAFPREFYEAFRQIDNEPDLARKIAEIVYKQI